MSNIEWESLYEPTVPNSRPYIIAIGNAVSFNSAARDMIKPYEHLILKIGKKDGKPIKIGFLPSSPDHLDARKVTIAKGAYRIHSRPLVKLMGGKKRILLTQEDNMLVASLED